MDIQHDFIEAIKAAGIELPIIDGIPSVWAAYDKIAGTDAEHALARIVCNFVRRPEWKAESLPSFYQTKCWLRARYMAFARHGNRCQCCGAGPQESALHVDHIKPRSTHPELSLSVDNLQILCADCNIGKGNKDATDWR